MMTELNWRNIRTSDGIIWTRCYISDYIKIWEVIKNYLSYVGQLLWAFTALKARKIFMVLTPSHEEHWITRENTEDRTI